MFSSLGNYVVSIHRLAIGDMQLSKYDIKLGEFKEITLDEIKNSIFE
jgi:16S rRNA U516 pseudouridylate synthase RsuA-like enzyme